MQKTFENDGIICYKKHLGFVEKIPGSICKNTRVSARRNPGVLEKHPMSIEYWSRRPCFSALRNRVEGLFLQHFFV